jgi:hypothetical protein
MENFFNYITSPLGEDEIDIWFRTNNICFEKLDLFFDFSYGLNKIVNDTYLGDTSEMTNEDNENHFMWCWRKNIDSFEKENIIFNVSGDHLAYFIEFFNEIFYKQKEKKVRESISTFITETFNLNTPFTKSDLDIILTIYKSLDTNMVYIA